MPDPSDRTVVERRDPLLGSVFDGRYRIDFRIAAGGFGAIYRAAELGTGAELALKVLHPELANDTAVVARFRREGAMLTALRDPHTVTAYEVGEARDGTLFIAMELLRGESLYERFHARGKLPWRQVATIARAICSSLGEAHALGIVHRDLKPANIHLEPRGADVDFVKVLDFGIAKIVRGNAPADSELTQAGQMIGTLDYMCPEQMVGGLLTGRSDIYSLGVLAYEMIAGRRPFAEAGASATSMLAALLTQVPPRLVTRVPVPEALDDAIMRCLAREPQDRWDDVGELAAALDAILAPAADEPKTVVSLSRPKPAPRGSQPGIAARAAAASHGDESTETREVRLEREARESDEARAAHQVWDPRDAREMRESRRTPADQEATIPIDSFVSPERPRSSTMQPPAQRMRPVTTPPPPPVPPSRTPGAQLAYPSSMPAPMPASMPSPMQAPMPARVPTPPPMPPVHVPTPPPMAAAPMLAASDYGGLEGPTPPYQRPQQPATPQEIAASAHAYPRPRTPDASGYAPGYYGQAPMYLPPPPPSYDMGRAAARDSLVRYIVWGAAIVVASVLLTVLLVGH
ncbi:MAG TPA: serine/threonine-protein kinase [Kofleriaceae bacterium]|jgi:serine/threonine-protein kinase